MTITRTIKITVFGLVAAGALALSANAQAVTLDAGVFATGAGDAANPITFNVTAGPNFFLDTINFDLGSFTHFNMTSTTNNINFFGSTIFDNVLDSEIPLGNGYAGAAPSFASLPLADLGQLRDYHLHPAGQNVGGGSYQIALWGSIAPVPVPAAVWLFGSGLVGVVGLARRKMSSVAA